MSVVVFPFFFPLLRASVLLPAVQLAMPFTMSCKLLQVKTVCLARECVCVCSSVSVSVWVVMCVRVSRLQVIMDGF